MVEIQCPHCVEIIDLEEGLFGLFECPFCEKEFEWSSERSPYNEELFNTKDFLIGLFAPSTPSIIGLLYSFVFTDGWDTLVGFVLSMLIWPVVAFIFLIYGIIVGRKFMIFGTAISFLLMMILFFSLFVLP